MFGMILLAWLTKKRHGCTKKTMFLSIMALLMVAFAAQHHPVSTSKNQFKMTVDDCMLENPNNHDICQAESSRLPYDNDKLKISCSKKVNNYGAPYKRPCVTSDEFKNLTDLTKATKICEAAEYKGEKCYIWTE